MSGTVHDGIYGNAGIVATFDEVVADVPAGAPAAFDGDLRELRITPVDKDDADLTFTEAASGETKDYNLVAKANQSTQSGSFWRMLWDNPAGVYDVVYGPHGNAVATSDKPHFTMRVKVDGRPDVGGAASRSRTRADFEYTFEVIDGPNLDTGV